MVNKEAFAKRLQEMMDYYEMSAAGLADKIGVQRSSISHLLSGRNNPSLDFVLKILDNYPRIDFNWLVKGIGKLESVDEDMSESQSSPTLFDQASSKKKEKSAVKFQQNSNNNAKTLEKIILLYADGSFESYDYSS